MREPKSCEDGRVIAETGFARFVPVFAGDRIKVGDEQMVGSAPNWP